MPNTPFNPDDTLTLVEAVRAMADTYARADVATEAGPTLNCGEAELLAEVMVLAGCRDEAAEWLAGHGIHDENDEEALEYLDEGDDQHGHLNLVDDRGLAIRNVDLARGYVDRRWPR